MGHLKRRVGAGTLVGHQEPAEDHPMRDDEMHERAMGVSDGYSSYPPNKFRRTPAGAWGGRARQEEAERTLVQQQQHARRNALPGGIIHHDSHEDGGPGTAGTGGHPSNPEMTRSPDANGSSHHVDSSSPHRQQSWGPGQQRRPVSPSHVSRADLGTPGSGTAASAPGTYHLGHEATSNATSSSWRASSGGGSDSGAGWQPRRQEDAGGGRGGAGSAVGISRPFSEQGVDDSGEISETSDRRGGGGSGRGGEYHRGTTGGRGSGSGSVASGEADIKYERYCQGGRRAFGGGGPAPPAVMRDGEGGYWEYPLGSSGGQGRVANREYWTHGAPSGTYARWDSRGVDPDRREDLRAWGGMHRPGAMDDHGDPEEYNEVCRPASLHFGGLDSKPILHEFRTRRCTLQGNSKCEYIVSTPSAFFVLQKGVPSKLLGNSVSSAVDACADVHVYCPFFSCVFFRLFQPTRVRLGLY